VPHPGSTQGVFISHFDSAFSQTIILFVEVKFALDSDSTSDNKVPDKPEPGTKFLSFWLSGAYHQMYLFLTSTAPSHWISRQIRNRPQAVNTSGTTTTDRGSPHRSQCLCAQGLKMGARCQSPPPPLRGSLSGFLCTSSLSAGMPITPMAWVERTAQAAGLQITSDFYLRQRWSADSAELPLAQHWLGRYRVWFRTQNSLATSTKTFKSSLSRKQPSSVGRVTASEDARTLHSLHRNITPSALAGFQNRSDDKVKRVMWTGIQAREPRKANQKPRKAAEAAISKRNPEFPRTFLANFRSFCGSAMMPAKFTRFEMIGQTQQGIPDPRFPPSARQFPLELAANTREDSCCKYTWSSNET